MSSNGDVAPQTPAPLRAADWRFLLPSMPGEQVGHLALLGGGAGMAERARSLGIAERVTAGLPPSGSADIVVATADAHETIDRIAGAVAPDGALYLEVDRLRRGRRTTTPGHIRSILAAAGLHVVTVYAVEPDLSNARVFIPVDTAGPLDWHRRTFVREQKQASPAIERLRRTAPGVAVRRTLTLRERYAVVATSAGRENGAPGLLVHPDVARISRDVAHATSAAMLTYGGDRVILFPFAPQSTAPIAVVKVPKTPDFVGRTENEQQRLRELRARLDPDIASAIPTPLGIAHAGSTSIACEQYRPGHTLAKRAASRSVEHSEKVDDLRRAMRWLARFHRATEVRRVGREGGAQRRIVEQPLDDYARMLGTRPDEARLFARVGAASDADGAELPIVCHHRDYAAWNLLRDGDEISVLDWEGAREGPALCDAIHLVTTWLYAVRLGAGSDDETGCVRDLFVRIDRADPSAQAARAVLDDYLAELELPRSMLPALVVHHRVELAVRRGEQHQLQNETGSGAEGDTAEVQVVRMLAVAADRLFAAKEVGA